MWEVHERVGRATGSMERRLSHNFRSVCRERREGGGGARVFAAAPLKVATCPGKPGYSPEALVFGTLMLGGTRGLKIISRALMSRGSMRG
jgi:hypothetical protein